MLAIAQDPDLARIWSKYVAGDSLTPEYTVRVEAELSNLFIAGEIAILLYELGLLDPDTWENVVLNAFTRFPPVAYKRWHDRRGPLAQRLLAYLE